MSDVTVGRLRQRGQALMEEVSREYYLAHAGHRSSAELQPIYARYSDILNEDALALVRDRFQQASEGTEERRGARLLLEWQIESQVHRMLAPLDEREIAWEATAELRLADGRGMSFQRAPIAIANASERAERLMIERARATLVASELAPLRQERFQREKDYVESLGLAPGYVPSFVASSGIDLPALVGECEEFLRDTQSMWDDVFADVVRSKLAIDPAEATRSDALALLRAPEYDRYFPRESMEPEVRRQVTEMGIDPSAGGRIRFDTGEREGKRARAFCAPVHVPDEVYLVLRPHGGQADYRTLLHELGHALHFGYVRADHPFEYRWLGDNSVTEAYAMLFDHLLHDAGWLSRYAALGRQQLPSFLHAVGFEELQFLRRYCAKLIYESALYSGDVPWHALPDLYVETLSGATSFRYDPADAFVDVDPHFYAARYLRAWQLQALISGTLIERFDEDWYRNPKAGPWIVDQLLGEGQRELGHELAERVAGRPLSFAPLVRATEALLVAS